MLWCETVTQIPRAKDKETSTNLRSIVGWTESGHSSVILDIDRNMYYSRKGQFLLSRYPPSYPLSISAKVRSNLPGHIRRLNYQYRRRILVRLAVVEVETKVNVGPLRHYDCYILNLEVQKGT